jgi:hypothetical protein
MSQKANHCIISSRDRQDLINETPSDFTVSLQNPIVGFNKFTLINVEIPSVFYNITNERQNTTFSVTQGVNTYPLSLPEGNYNLNNYLSSFQAIGLSNIPGFNLDYDMISSRVIISATSNFSINFQTYPQTAYALGFNPTLLTGSNSYTALRPTNIESLGILIVIDIVTNTVSTSNPNFRSSSFFINNTVNSQEYIQFFENSMYSHSVYTNHTFINNMKIQLYDSDGYLLKNSGDWIMIFSYSRD